MGWNQLIRICLIDLIWLATAVTALYPVILIPGDGASQIEGFLNKNASTHFYCEKHSDWFTIFLNVQALVPVLLPCYADNLQLLYDNKTGNVRNQDGVQTRIPGFGQTSTVEYFSNTHLSETQYFFNIAEALVNDPALQYRRGDTLVGAPFDFRSIPQPDVLEPYFKALRELIETTSARHGNVSCVLTSHSLGATLTWMFLNRMDAAWKARYVRLWFALSPPLGGVVKTLRVVASGDNLGAFFVDRLKLRPLQRTFPSVAFLFPRPPYWNLTEPLLFTPRRNYSIADFEALMNDLGVPAQYDFWRRYAPLYDGLQAPGVETHCIYGSGIETPGHLSWPTQASFPNSYPQNDPDDGDGTVNIRSLRICSEFAKSQSQPVYTTVIPAPDGEHLRILRNQNLTSYIVNALKRSLRYVPVRAPERPAGIL